MSEMQMGQDLVSPVGSRERVFQASLSLSF